jgi:hypothetical protein
MGGWAGGVVVGARTRRENTGSTGHNVYPVCPLQRAGQGSRRSG